MTVGDDRVNLHAGVVALQGLGLLILGASGAGKSGLAFALMALGAGLVSDDRSEIWREGSDLIADAPDSIRGQIEARGVGILHAPAVGPVVLSLAVDLSRPETARLPDAQFFELLGIKLPLVLGQGRDHLAPVLMHYLKHGRIDRQH